MALEAGVSPMLRLLFSPEEWQRAHVRHCWSRAGLHTPSNAPPLSSLLFFTCHSSSLRSTRQEWKDSSQWIMLFSASVEMLMAQHLLLFRSLISASVWLCKASVRTAHLTARESYVTLIIWKGKWNITLERLGQRCHPPPCNVCDSTSTRNSSHSASTPFVLLIDCQ